jgi:preprotein translocase subunit Sec63
MNPYEALGVQKGASDDEVKRRTENLLSGFTPTNRLVMPKSSRRSRAHTMFYPIRKSVRTLTSLGTQKGHKGVGFLVVGTPSTCFRRCSGVGIRLGFKHPVALFDVRILITN